MDRKIGGFSILEILIIIAILSILMALSVSTYAKYRLDRELTRQANQLIDEIAWVKSQSIAKGPHGIMISSNSYIIFRDLNGDCSYTENEDEIVVTVQFIKGISIDFSNSENVSETIVFDRKGYPRVSNCALGTVEGTITLKNTNNTTKNIKISRYGRIRLE